MDIAHIVEVGPRDGLQNETRTLSTQNKISLIERLTDAGIRHIESGSFVSPKWIPQMADSEQIFSTVKRLPEVTYAALVPNSKGMALAIKANVDEIAVFTAASETFTQRNINCSVAESIERFRPVIEKAKVLNIPVRGYVSCIIGCPYEGPTAARAVVQTTAALIEAGCYQVSLGDTIGVGTPAPVQNLLMIMLTEFDAAQLAVHFHDTYGQALANIDRALELGIRTIDSSIAGLGGCPYADGATGNVATEDVVYMLNGCGIHTGTNLEKLVQTGQWICNVLGRDNGSKVGRALGNL